MSLRELNFDKHNVSWSLKEVKRMFWMDFEDGCRWLFKEALEKAMATDLGEYLQAGRHERGERRRGYRNGYRGRRLLTGFGEVGLKVPRDREGRYHPGYFERYKRSSRKVEEGIRAMFLRGVSTRKVADILDALCGYSVSAGYVSKVTGELDGLVREYANAPIDDEFMFLFIDGISVRIKYGIKGKRMVILAAYGVSRDGSRRLISFQLSKKESRAAYLAFLENIKARGLEGRNLELIIMDGAPGLWSAVEEVYPQVEHQLCWVHKLRNVSNYCPKRYRQQCTRQAAEIMYAKSSGKAAVLFRRWKKKWIDKIPKAVRCLEKDFDRLIPFLEFPAEYHKIIRTTNVIERCFREVRRRLKVMGYFQNSKSCKRIVTSIFEYFNAKWHCKTHRIKPITQHFYRAA
jgi:putative transposase